MRRLAIITTHPIQYNAPWFRLLAERGKIAIKVFYTWSQVEKQEKYDPGFGKNVRWDIPLLEGYDYTFVENISKNPGSKSYSGIDNPTLIAEINGWKPDAVLVFGWKFKSHLRAIKYFHGRIPVLFRGDSTTIDDRKGIPNWLRYKSLKHVYNNIDYALYTGNENKKYFLKSGLKANQLVYVPHAVENIRFLGGENENDLREKLDIPEHATVFLFAGKFEDKKNPFLLGNAFLSAKIEGSHLVFVGNGPLEQELKSKFHRRTIHFLNFQNQQKMPSIYKMCDVFVLPSQGPGETWGLAVNEAMAAGKPVLVSDKCGCAVDLVEEGVNGYTFKSGDVDDLGAKLRLFMDRRQDLKKMGERGSEKIQDWSFEKIVTVVEGVVMRDSQ